MKYRNVVLRSMRVVWSDPTRILHRIIAISADVFWMVFTALVGMGSYPPIEDVNATKRTLVDEYWTQHTVNSPRFYSAYQSQKYLDKRFSIYPLFKELTGLYGEHDDETILDYGCGPGNDLVGFVLYTSAKKIIGMDISLTSLKLASRRLALHKVDVNRIELVQLSDSAPEIKLAADSIDFISCQGVLMHTSFPDHILSEFYRVLKLKGHACVMVYNRESIWFHLYTAYDQMVINSNLPGMSVAEAFSRNTDGVDCPVARCWPPDEFVAMCESAGFACDYVGGYLSDTELNSLKKFHKQAIGDERLGAEHKEYLRELVFDDQGMPIYKGKYAGVSGVYLLQKNKV
jgi:ubiquinone/menaquinone biosynthesis C-methylase UbiE